MTEPHRLSLERIAQAAGVIDPVFLDSPQFLAESLGPELGCRLVVKVETLNPIRSFKGRGAEYFAASLEGRPHLVCTTAGNFGQGLAYAARKRGLPLTIFSSLHANPLKVERMRALGAEVRLAGEDFDAAHEVAKRFAAEIGARLVEDGRDAGHRRGRRHDRGRAAPLARALRRDPGAAGRRLAARRDRPLGEGAPAGHPDDRRLRQRGAGHGAVVAVGAMAGDGARGHDRGRDRRAQPVSGGARRPHRPDRRHPPGGGRRRLWQAMRRAHQELGLVLEPSGAASLAALLAHRERFEGQLVGAILSGGNITVEQMQQWLAP